MNPDRAVRLVSEAYAIVADSQPQLAGFALEFLYITFASLSEALDRGEDSHRHLPVDAAYVGARILRPVDFPRLSRRLLFALEIVRREAKLGENFFLRDSLSTTLLEPGLRLGDCLTLARTLGFVIDWSVRNCARDGIQQAFQHANCGRQLVRRQLFDQFVGMLFICRHNKIILHADP
jgi:hypothetical protein